MDTQQHQNINVWSCPACSFQNQLKCSSCSRCDAPKSVIFVPIKEETNHDDKRQEITCKKNKHDEFAIDENTKQRNNLIQSNECSMCNTSISVEQKKVSASSMEDNPRKSDEESRDILEMKHNPEGSCCLEMAGMFQILRD